MRRIYYIENLDCPHCAGKIESEIQKLTCVKKASLSFATKQLHIEANDETGLLEKIQSAADRIEDGVVFREACESHNYHDGENALQKEIVVLVIGILVLMIAFLTEWFTDIPYVSEILMLLAYLIMGWKVLFSSFKSILKGSIFDENFLMSIATIGALLIGCQEEAASVMLFFRLGEMFEHLAVERSRKSIMDAIDFRVETVQRITDHATETIPADSVKIGDILMVCVGDRIPVDGRVLKGESSLDTSAMTGESIPVQVRKGDAVMSGCINLSGAMEIEVTATLQNSLVSRILDSVENAAAGKPKIDRFITRFARVYTPIVVIIAILTAIIPSIITGEWKQWIYTALNFLMISCPCALVLSVPLAFFSGIGAGSRRGILFKDGIFLEILTKIKAVVMDKTGTLTNGVFSVASIETDGCERDTLLAVCASCESASSHPIAHSITAYAEQNGLAIVPANHVREVAGKGITGEYNGKNIICGTRAFLTENGITAPDIRTKGTKVYVAENGAYLGCLILSDLSKPTAVDVIAELRSRGLHTVMLTGDNSENAEAVAQELHIEETYAGLLPDEKPEYMKKMRHEYGSVLFVGDGINDAPVLSGADVGAAMGSGADAAMEAADIVFLTSDPKAIIESIQISERVNRTARINIIFALTVKILIMLLGFAGYANMWLSVFADTGVTILCVLFVLVNIHFHYHTRQ